LIVDDEPDVLRAYADILGSAGYEVTTAATADEGLARIAEAHPDILLLDIMLPGKDGTQLAAELAENPRTAGIPIVVITALNTFPPDGDGVPGVRRVIYKPCRPRTLIESIDEVVRRPSARPRVR
jgi:CheY-like chemotaxis protein